MISNCLYAAVLTLWLIRAGHQSRIKQGNFPSGMKRRLHQHMPTFLQVLHSGDLVAEGRIRVGNVATSLDTIPSSEVPSKVKACWAAGSSSDCSCYNMIKVMLCLSSARLGKKTVALNTTCKLAYSSKQPMLHLL
jgi:hypothetical protein